MRVKVGQTYRFEPSPMSWDRLDPPVNVKPGDLVTVKNLAGLPGPAGTMGHCHVMRADDGAFGGLVLVNSLRRV